MTQQTTRHVRRHRHHRGVGFYLSLVMMTLLCALILLPIIFTFLYSFFPKGEITSFLNQRNNYDASVWMDVPLSPAVFSLRQYYKILIEEPSYLQLFCNSVMYTAAILVGQGLVIPLTAYALSRFEFRGKNFLTVLIMMLMVLPCQVTMAPSVITLRTIGLMDTPWAVILPMVFSPFYIFLLRQFMVGLPNGLLEAGMIDGAGPVRGFVHVILPVCKPILGAAAALSFADCWNMVEQPLVYLANNTALQPLSVMFNQISTEGADIAFAGSALYILPTMLIYLYFQEDILQGVQLSELK